jgi:hypothetical protein
MIDPPQKSGWHWIVRVQDKAVPEVAFWTGASFLTISDVLPLEGVAMCDEEPLRAPMSMTSSCQANSSNTCLHTPSGSACA